MPRIGELRTRVSVLRASSTRDDQGGISDATPTLVFEAWAEVLAKSGSQLFAANQLQPRVYYQVTMRERRDIRSGDYLRYEGTGGTRNLRVDTATVLEERSVWTVAVCQTEVPSVLGSCS